RPDRRRAGAPARRHAEGAVQPPLPGGDGRAREHDAAQARKARDRPHPDRAARPKRFNTESAELEMAEKKKQDETIEEPEAAVAETPVPPAAVEEADAETQEPGAENQVPESAPEP